MDVKEALKELGAIRRRVAAETLERRRIMHTPIPWRVSGCRMRTLSKHDNYLVVHGDEQERSPLIAEVFTDDERLPVEANAEFIVRACNSHDKLLEALEGLTLLRTIKDGPHAGAVVIGPQGWHNAQDVLAEARRSRDATG